jgi:signal transduction histidine kinase
MTYATPPSAHTADTSASSRNPLNWFMRWLRKPPIVDPVERRNGPMLQVLLLILSIGYTLSLIPEWLIPPHNPFDLATLLRDIVTFSMFWSCLWVVRTGRFRLSASLLIGMTLVLMAISYQHHGITRELPLQATQIYPIVLGGLLLGRRALWAITLAMLCILGTGALVDGMRPGGDTEMAVINFVRCSLGFLIVAVILDRAVSSLRDALELANRHREDLQRSQAQLIQAQKVEAVGRVSSGIAHDFNNILGVIMGYASRPDASESLPVAADSLDGIKLAAQRGAMAIRRILSLGRNQNVVREVVDVHAVIGDILPLMQQIFGARVVLRTHLVEQAIPVWLDRSEFELTLLNLATNARDAMPGGGTFSIVTASDGDAALITLTDDGQGMDAETRERLFDLFYTTKPEGLGSGIGLAVVKRFVDDAGGDIDVTSEKGRGTAIRIRLPLTVTFAGKSLAAANSIGGVRVLLVEDDEALRGLLADALRAAGADVLAAGSGAEAIALAGNAAGIDVLITDFHLPDGTGNDVLERIAGMHRDVRCLIISANESLAAFRPVSGHPLQVLAKPFAPARLVDAVGAMVSRELEPLA